MLLPQGVAINGENGAVSPATGSYTKRLSELKGLFRDAAAYEAALLVDDPMVYEVHEYRKANSDLFFGTTTMFPGKVGQEFYLTRGHFHARRDMGEVYYTQHGSGVLLLESRGGECKTVDMKPGVCAFIPPNWAHRSINIGDEKLVFVWVCNPEAGHDYAEILKRGMRKIVIDVNGEPSIVDNPAFASSRVG